jgi:lipid-A-disaccharide synthase
MKIFFSVGEPSGDLHGANLIRELRARRPEIEIVGYGGPKMAQAGCQLHEDLTKLAVMWFARVLLNLHRFYWLLRRARRTFREQRPDAVVLIDYPGFNWHIAKAAKRQGIPVFYYGTPQLWAWASWRIKKMRRNVDHVLCNLPFEEPWYRQQGCHATYVGHPYFDELRSRKLDDRFMMHIQQGRGPLVTILPGSRTQEVTHNLRWFLKAAQIIRRQVPHVRFAVATFNTRQANYARRKVDATDLPMGVFVGRTPELIQAADCCLAVSGSVSLELLYHTKPAVILYWISRPAYFVQGLFRKVKYITLANLLECDNIHPSDLSPFDPNQADAERVPFPEYLTYEDRSEQLAAHVREWLTDENRLRERRVLLHRLKDSTARAGASRRAAEHILTELEQPGRAAA